MDKRIADLTAESVGLQKEVSKLEAELTTVSNELTLEDAKTRLAEVNADIAKGEEQGVGIFDSVVFLYT